MKTFFKKYHLHIFALFIFLLALFLRTYNLSNIYVFNFDEEYQATYAWTQVLDPHPIWIGVSASFLDFYLGPYFTYFTAVLLWLSKGDPMIGAYFAAFLGSVTTLAFFFIGWRIFNLTTGIIASLLYATLPLFVFFDQKYWNTMFTPLITLLLFTQIYLVKKSIWFWVLYAALVGAILQTHLEPIPLITIGLFYFLKGGYWKNIRLLLAGIFVFALFYWPLAVFDYHHNFSNLTILSRFKEHLGESKIAFNPYAKFQTLFDSMGRFWYLKPGNPNADEINFGCTSLSVREELAFIDKFAKRTYAPIWLSTLTLLMIVIFLKISFRNKQSLSSIKKREYRLLGIFLSVATVFFMIYPGGSSEYYTLSLLVLFTLVPGILISYVKKYQFILFGLILMASLFGIHTVINASDEFSMGPKRVIIAEVMKVIGDKSFAIEGRGVCHDYEGWRYLFKAYGRQPGISYTDKNLGWLYPEEIDTTAPAYTIILSEDRIPLKEDLSTLSSIKAGGYRAYIKKNL